MLRIGIVGFGFMGNMHFNNYSKVDGAEVVAICDIEQDKLSGSTKVAGNISGSDSQIDMSKIQTFTDAEEMFNKANLDAVSITLPTYLHKEYTIKALDAGLHALCEKPMALDSDQCKEMIDASKKNAKTLQVGHCIRFWPEYAKTKEIIESGKYGKVKTAMFRRLSMTPGWAWDGWLLDPKRSGGAILDLHIHDADFVQYLFGMPNAVFSRYATGQQNGLDHVVTQYIFDDGPAVTTEGGWIMPESFGFEMSFEVVLEKATICFDCTKEPSFKVCTDSNEEITPAVEQADGYLLELKHFVNSINGKNVPTIITPEQSMQSVKLIEAERTSCNSVEKVSL